MPRFIDVDQTLSSAAAADYACAAIGAPRVANVVSYGATGDGATDDATAIQAALDSATDVNLFFPAGTYRIGAPLVKTGGRLRIEGSSNATIKPTNSYTPGSDTAILEHEDPVETFVDGLTIDGNSTAINGGSSYADWTNYIYGISVVTQDQDVADAARVVIRNCLVKDYPSIAISVVGLSNVHIDNNVVEDGEFHGIAVARSSGATAGSVSITNNRITGRGDRGTAAVKGQIGILVTKMDRVDVIGNYISNTSDTGTKTEGCNEVTYRGNVVVDAGKDGIKIQEHVTIPPGDPIYAVSRGIIENNIVMRINAWRSDGTSLILTTDLTHGIIANNLLIGGGTRTADAVRVNIGPGANYSECGDILIKGNVALETLSAGIRITSGDQEPTRSMARVSILGNRLSAAINGGGGGVLSGDWAIKDNVITVPDGAGLAATWGIQLTNLYSGSAVIEGNQIASHTYGIRASTFSSAEIDTIRLARNALRNTGDLLLRVENSTTTTSAVQIVDISDNSCSDPTSAGATVTAPWRVDLAYLAVGVLRVSGNVFDANSGSGGFTYAGQVTGTPATPVELMEVRDNVNNGTFSSTTTITGLTIGTQATRVLGQRWNAAPTAGTWKLGDAIENSAPTEAGSTSSKYVVTGWRCVTAGTPGTWVQERSLTGN